MAGEIREAMAQLKLAKLKMIGDLKKEIDGVGMQIVSTHADGLDAMKLVRAEVDQTAQEIREIRAEFAPLSNGGPSGPLPDTPSPSPQPSTTSDASVEPLPDSTEKKT